MIELRRILFEGHSISYSWNGGLGLNFIHNLSQMAVSPFVLLTFLFPVKDITEGIALLLLLKVPFAAVTLNLYVRNRFKLKDAAIVVISIMYALSAYVTANHFNTMWFEGVILLPLIAMGIERLVKDGKSLLYVLSLSLAIFTNYLIGLYLCGFSLLYFIANLFLRKVWGDRPALRRTWFVFITRSLLAAGLVGFFIIPIAVTLRGTGYVNTTFPTTVKLNFSVLKLFVSHFWGIYPSILTFSSVSGPNIYCGVLTVLLLPLFYFNRNISRREKLLDSAICLFLIAGFIVNVVDFVYNGFRFTSMFPHRFSFIYSFMLIIMALRAFLNLDGKWAKALYVSAPVFIALLAASFILYPQRRPEVQKPGAMSLQIFVVNVALIAALSALLIVYVKFKDKKPLLGRILAIAMAAVTVGEISTSAMKNMGVMDELKRDAYMEPYDDMVDVSKYLANEDAFYRATFKHNLSLCDARLFNYKDATTFSAMQSSVTDLGDRLGLTSTMNSLLLTNPTPLVSSIFSIKYLMDRQKELPKSFTIYDFKQNFGSIHLHENPFVLPVAFLVDDGILGWDIKSSENVYEVQNDFARKATGIEGDVMVPIAIDRIVPENLTLNETEEFQKYTADITVDPADGLIPSITMYFIADKEGYMNIHVRTGSSTSGRVWVGEDNYILNQMTGNLQAVMDAGYVHVGDEVKVIVNMDRKRLDTEDMDAYVPFSQFDVNAAVMDQPNFERVISRLGSNGLEVSYYDDTTIRGTITADRQGMLFTSIPNDNGWKVIVDGKEREVMSIGTALVGVRLDPGTHEIEFKYGLSGAWLGLLVSLASVALMLIIFLLPFLRRRRLSALGLPPEGGAWDAGDRRQAAGARRDAAQQGGGRGAAADYAGSYGGSDGSGGYGGAGGQAGQAGQGELTGYGGVARAGGGYGSDGNGWHAAGGGSGHAGSGAYAGAGDGMNAGYAAGSVGAGQAEAARRAGAVQLPQEAPARRPEPGEWMDSAGRLHRADGGVISPKADAAGAGAGATGTVGAEAIDGTDGPDGTGGTSAPAAWTSADGVRHVAGRPRRATAAPAAAAAATAAAAPEWRDSLGRLHRADGSVEALGASEDDDDEDAGGFGDADDAGGAYGNGRGGWRDSYGGRGEPDGAAGGPSRAKGAAGAYGDDDDDDDGEEDY
jgi:uncharacterized membrane protein YfhO